MPDFSNHFGTSTNIGELQLEMHERHTQASDFESVLEDLRQPTAPMHSAGKAFMSSALDKPSHKSSNNVPPPPQAGPSKRGFFQLDNSSLSQLGHHTSDEFSYLRKRIRLLEEMEDQENSMSPMPENKSVSPIASSSNNSAAPSNNGATRRTSSSSSSGAPTPGRRESSFQGPQGKSFGTNCESQHQ